MSAHSHANHPSHGQGDDVQRLLHALDHAAHLLPTQPPIRQFVHHNTLHAFEHLPFQEAVEEASERYGAEPYESEAGFARHIASGRIRSMDIDAALEAYGRWDHKPNSRRLFRGGPASKDFYRTRLRHLVELPRGAAVEWVVEESQALTEPHSCASEETVGRLVTQGRALLPGQKGSDAASLEASLTALWTSLLVAAQRIPTRQSPGRRVASPEIDAFLGRLCAAFVDQGVGYWTLPHRELGLYAAFSALYRLPWGPPDRWLKGLAAELERHHARHWTPSDVVLNLLGELGHKEDGWVEALEAQLLALPGWAGMIRQLELRPDRAPVWEPPARLIDFVAVRLTLEAVWRRAAREESEVAPPAATGRQQALELTYESFIMAQAFGLGPSELSQRDSASAWVNTIAEFDEIKRRAILHLAFEHQHRVMVLDALLAHAHMGYPEPPPASAQLLFCIDEREESFRRHIEEVRPDVETYGLAGFFGVAMAFQGLDDIRPMPLCPINITPKHLVQEVPLDPDQAKSAGTRRKVLGFAQRWTQVSSRTALRGGAVAAVLGLGSVVPLILRCLFPRVGQHLARATEATWVGTSRTALAVPRAADAATNPAGLLQGYSVAEMARIVSTALRTTGASGRLSPLVVLFGHGSSSLNNPHEAAYDCGACGGGRGGPNARAFAAMANHAEVRQALVDLGLRIPDGTWFVGAYHNTCDDSVTYFDTELIPAGLIAAFASLQRSLNEARQRNAHERLRRFEDVSPGVPLSESLKAVTTRSADLGQPRPERGHVTNAICIVGRRLRSRDLFLDRRAFLVSYDPLQDRTGELLGPLLQAVGPVGAGINLEYYFSYVDNNRYGAGTKLPHNITSLIGVMDGHASDLRTGLPWQMVEIHEPVRLLTIVEAEESVLARVLEEYPAVADLVTKGWIQLVAWSPTSHRMSVFQNGSLRPYTPESLELPTVASSREQYQGHREFVPCARIEARSHVPARYSEAAE